MIKLTYTTDVSQEFRQAHQSSNLTKKLLRYIRGISLGSMRLVFIELSCFFMRIFMLKSTLMTSKNRLMSSIFELNQDTPEIHHGIGVDPMHTDTQTGGHAHLNSPNSYTQPTQI